MSKKRSKEMSEITEISEITESSKINETLNFEVALTDLESIVQKMETGTLSLEDSLKNFEKGISLARQCQGALKAAEQKVHILIQQNGEVKKEPFLVDED